MDIFAAKPYGFFIDFTNTYRRFNGTFVDRLEDNGEAYIYRAKKLYGTFYARDGKMVILNTDAVMKWGDDIVYTKAGPTRTMAPRPSYTLKELPLPEVTSDWSEYYINIIDVLDGKADLIVKPDQVLRVMKVIDLIFEVDRVGHGLPCYI